MRGELSPAEFAATVRRAAREIGEKVSCDARYIGRVESGVIRCPNYAYERVFRHLFPGRTLADMGFAPREVVRGHGRQHRPDAAPAPDGDWTGRQPDDATAAPPDDATAAPPDGSGTTGRQPDDGSAPATPEATAPAGQATAPARATTAGPVTSPSAAEPPRCSGRTEELGVAAVEEAVRRIRVLDDRYGADSLYLHAARPLRAAYALLDTGAHHSTTARRLYAATGELAITTGWLAHDSGRLCEARAHYAQALATARLAGDHALEAHAFCNTAFLARDAGRPGEAVHAAQAAQRAAAQHLASARLLSLLALREAGGWAVLGDRASCEHALLRAQALFCSGPADADPAWMSFFGEAELEGLEAQCWSALGDWQRAAEHAHRAVDLQHAHFTRNRALFTTEWAANLARQGKPEAAAAAGSSALTLLRQVRSTRIHRMLDATARDLRPQARDEGVADFLVRHAEAVRGSRSKRRRTPTGPDAHGAGRHTAADHEPPAPGGGPDAS